MVLRVAQLRNFVSLNAKSVAAQQIMFCSSSLIFSGFNKVYFKLFCFALPNAPKISEA